MITKLSVIIVLIIVIIAIRKYKFQNTKIKKYVFGSGSPIIGIIGGVHGNEISGSVALNTMIKSGFFNNRHGTIKIIPSANEVGLKANTRTNNGVDMNRIYGNNIGNIAKEILDFFADCSLVIDLHEGWGWHQIQPASLGSTITPSNPETHKLATAAAEAVNLSIHDPQKHFIVKHWSIIPCEIYSTLSCWNQRHNKSHILIEITGQNNIQPLDTRIKQITTILETILHNIS